MTHPFRIIFVGQSGPYAPRVLTRLLESRGRWEVVAVVQGLGKQSVGPTYREVLPRNVHVDEQSLSQVAGRSGLRTLQTRDINASSVVHVLHAHRADLLVCAGFDRLFNPRVLESARWGGINLHPSQLPEWRGPAPLFWALREGRRRIGVTVHRLDPYEDHGAILGEGSFERNARMSGSELYRAAADCASSVLLRTLHGFAKGDLRGRSQNDLEATRAPRPTTADARVHPPDWGCEHLTDFVTAARYFCRPWLQFGTNCFFVRGAREPTLGSVIARGYVLDDALLTVQCTDGLAHLEVSVR